MWLIITTPFPFQCKCNEIQIQIHKAGAIEFVRFQKTNALRTATVTAAMATASSATPQALRLPSALHVHALPALQTSAQRRVDSSLHWPAAVPGAAAVPLHFLETTLLAPSH